MTYKKELRDLVKVTGGRISCAQVFSDFVAFCALMLSITTDPVHREKRLEQFIKLTNTYKPEEQAAFRHHFQQIMESVTRSIESGDFTDLFSEAYMELGHVNHSLGQSFTPESCSKLLSGIILPKGTPLPESGYFTMSDPTCGSGILLLTGAERLARIGYNPATQLVMQAADMDLRCVQMAYLNLSLYGIPAVIVHGDTITLQEYDRWYTPAYLWGKWVWREPMLFGTGGYADNERLKMFDEPMYAAFRMVERLIAAAETRMEKGTQM